MTFVLFLLLRLQPFQLFLGLWNENSIGKPRDIGFKCLDGVGCLGIVKSDGVEALLNLRAPCHPSDPPASAAPRLGQRDQYCRPRAGDATWQPQLTIFDSFRHAMVKKMPRMYVNPAPAKVRVSVNPNYFHICFQIKTII